MQLFERTIPLPSLHFSTLVLSSTFIVAFATEWMAPKSREASLSLELDRVKQRYRCGAHSFGRTKLANGRCVGGRSKRLFNGAYLSIF